MVVCTSAAADIPARYRTRRPNSFAVLRSPAYTWAVAGIQAGSEAAPGIRVGYALVLGTWSAP